MTTNPTTPAPWEIHPALAEERLQELAAIIQQVRNDALEDFDPAKGDGPWSHGCRVYERTCFAITQAADGLPWLTVVQPPLQFVFAVEGVPVRFYHGDLTKPKTKYALMSAAELDAVACQLELFPEYGHKNPNWPWRLVVQTDGDGSVLRIAMVQLDTNGHPRNPWFIPLGDNVVPFSPVAGDLTEGVQLPPPHVSPKYPDTKTHDEGGNDDEGGE